jgi:hypothetical protein
MAMEKESKKINEETGELSYDLEEFNQRFFSPKVEVEANKKYYEELPEDVKEWVEPPPELLECGNCGTTHSSRHMVNMLCFNCQWLCPQCEDITVKPENDYICETCRYGDSTKD